LLWGNLQVATEKQEDSVDNSQRGREASISRSVLCHPLGKEKGKNPSPDHKKVSEGGTEELGSSITNVG